MTFSRSSILRATAALAIVVSACSDDRVDLTADMPAYCVGLTDANG